MSEILPKEAKALAGQIYITTIIVAWSLVMLVGAIIGAFAEDGK